MTAASKTSVMFTRTTSFFAAIRRYKVMVDGDSIAKIINGGTVSFEVDAGRREFWISLDWRRSESIFVDCPPGGTVQFSCTGYTEGFSGNLSLTLEAIRCPEVHDEKQGKDTQPSDVPEPHPDDAREFAKILGLSGKVTMNDIKLSYKKLAHQYHPDKSAHLGPKIQELCEREMKAINEAYDYFRAKYGD